MKVKFILLLVIGTLIILTGFKPASEKKDELPFTTNYSLSLKTASDEHLEKYDYIQYIADDDIIQLKHYHNISKDKAKKMIEDRRYFLLAMFKDQPNPYPGVLSNNIGCPKELQPKANEDTVGITRLSFKLLATSTLVFGNCNINDNYYYCAYTLFFCPVKNDFFEFKIYTPIKAPSFNYDSLVTSIRCN
jgi:hypothetical protein